MKPNSKYKWKYVARTNAKAARIAIMFKSFARLGSAQSDWCTVSKWVAATVPAAPPVGGSLWLMK